MDEYPLESGIVFLIIGITLLIFRLKQNNSFKMSEYNMMDWKELTYTWGLIIMSFIFGLLLIFKN